GHGATAERVGELAHADPVDALLGEPLLGHRAQSRAERVDLVAGQVLGHGAQASGGKARGNSRTYLRNRARWRSEATSTRGRKRIVSSTGASSAMSRRTNSRSPASCSAAPSRPCPTSRTP